MKIMLLLTDNINIDNSDFESIRTVEEFKIESVTLQINVSVLQLESMFE